MDKCYYKKRIKERVFNAQTGRWTTSWIDIPSTTTTTPARKSDISFRGIGSLCQPKTKPRPFKLIQLRGETIYTEPSSQKRTTLVEHRNVKIYTDDESTAHPDRQSSFVAATFTTPVQDGIEQVPPIKNAPTYGQRQQKLADRWKSKKPTLEKAYFNSQSPASFECAMCGKEEEKIFFCPDCGPNAYYCEPCVENIHRIATLHIPVKWDGQVYIPYKWYKELRLPNHHCPEITIPGFIFLIDEKGREHRTMVHYCQCMTKVETLVMLGFWPSSPQRPKYAIDLRFMEKARAFLLEGAVALRKFCSSIKEHLLYLPTYGFEVDLYRVLSKDCATQHRNFSYDVSHLTAVLPSFPDSSECPICKKTENVLPKIVSMDGNFRLVRKKSSGRSYAEPHHGSRLFIEKEDYLPFLSKEKAMPTADHGICSDFKAGDTKKSTFRSTKLDVSGVFGSVCAHDYPQKFVDLEAGEKIGYAVCLINQWKDSPAGLKVTYDIACRIKPQLQRSGVDLTKITLAVPAFHLYAHRLKCTVEYNPRLLDQFRNTDGENIERLWSYLGLFTYITKEMTASNRRDLLVDALLHYGKKVIRHGGKRLKARLENARTEKHRAITQREQAKIALASGGKEVDETVLQTLEAQYKSQVDDGQKTKETSWKESYVTTLNTFFSLSLKLVEPPLEKEEIERKTNVQKLEEKLNQVENTHKMKRWTRGSATYKSQLKAVQDGNKESLLKKLHREAVERQHHLLRKREARGHDAAAKVAKQLRSTNSRIEKLVGQYNLVCENPITFEVAKDNDSPLYDRMVTNIDGPYRLVREVVISSNRIRRCDEEIAAIKIEIPALLYHQKEIHQLLEDALQEPDISAGERCSIFQRLCENEKEQMFTLDAIRKAIPDAQHMYTSDRSFLTQLDESIKAMSECPAAKEDEAYSSSDSDYDTDDPRYDDDALASSDEE